MSTDLPPALRAALPAREGLALAGLTSLGVGGPAPWVLEPRTRDELVLAVRELNAAGRPFRMLGHGSNVLVGDTGVPEVVITTRCMRGLVRDGRREHALRCEAGASLAALVSLCRRTGLTGAEMLVGIPGTVGGAVAGNAGGRHGAVGDVLAEVTLVGQDGSLQRVPCRPDDFGYRRSPFRGQVVLDAVVQLTPAAPEAVFERMRAILQEKAASQPLSAASAGCMFKNTPGAPSGRLIEDAGCKALSVGAARISERHANFMVNEGRAASSDVARLIALVRERVKAHCGVALELEIECWGEV